MPTTTMDDLHTTTVAAVASRVRHFASTQTPFRVYHGSTNSTRATHRSASNTVDTSSLNRVLSVSRETSTCLCEPNVPMDTLLDATLPHGLVCPVVMELPSITVGGGFSGMAGESSSARHGPFDSVVRAIEMVTGDGEVVWAYRSGERADLFWAAACGFGTLGVVTCLELELRPATKYVAITHMPCADMADAVARLQEQVSDPDVDLVDGIMFSPTAIVVCSGRYTDADPPRTQAARRYLGRWDPWFYLDVQRRTSGGKKQITEWVPLRDYLFRWDRGGFWVAKYAFRYFLTPFNRVTRGILDTFMHAKVMYHALHKSGLSDQHIIQDVGVPYERADEFHGWLRQTFDIYPLWLCPIRIRRPADAAHGLHADFADPDKTPEFLLNFGVWGPAAKEWSAFVKQNRDLEHKVHELGGKKTLYAQNHYTEDEFWDAYPTRDNYEGVRARYGSAWMPDVWQKVGKVDEVAKRREWEGSRVPEAVRRRWPFMGLYGVYKAWRGGDYLLQKEKEKGAGAGKAGKAE